MLVSRDADLFLCIDTSHLDWISCWIEELTSGFNLHGEQLCAGLCHDQGFLLLAGPLSHYHQYQNGIAPSRSGHKSICHSMPRGDSWYVKWDDFQYLRTQLPPSKISSQSKLQHHIVLYKVRNFSILASQILWTFTFIISFSVCFIPCLITVNFIKIITADLQIDTFLISNYHT